MSVPLSSSGAPPPGGAPHPASRGDNLAVAPVAEDEAEFDRLVSDIQENPDIILRSTLTAEQVLEIQKRLNPYAGIAGPAADPDHKTIAACSYTNLREDYIRRFTMTSLAGFLFQILHEWEVPAAARRWVPATPKRKKTAKAAAAAAAHEPFDADALVQQLEATLAIAREAAACSAAAAAHSQAARELDLLPPSGQPAAAAAAVAEQAAAADACAAKAAGLLYAATHAAHRVGLEAGARLRSTAEAGMRYPAVREVLSRYPLPPPPAQIEMPPALAKEIIGGFLRHWLVFDPSVHVRSGHDEKAIAAAVEMAQVGAARVPVDTKDPGHLTLAAVRAAAPAPAPEHREAVAYILASKPAYDAVAALLRDADLVDYALLAIQDAATFQQYLFPVPAGSPARPAADHVPPQDTFHRWGYYTEVNYEQLRTVTEALYPERPDLDWALALWAVFSGTQKEVDAAFEQHCQRYQDEIPSSIRALEFGHWSLLADFTENRRKIQFYNKHTEVLKRILDRHAEDKRIGAELMRNRVRQTKAANIAEAGPDAAGLKAYRRGLAEMGLDLGGQGAERVIGPEEMRRLEKARGSVKAAQELELLEQTEKRIRELTELEALRVAAGQALSAEEQRDLDHARATIDGIREMVAVPDDAIQVDVFTSNPATGDFGKTHFYTKAEAPEHIAQARREAEAARGRGGAHESMHPAVLASLGAARPPAPDEAPRASPGTGPSPPADLVGVAPGALPAFAPFAVEHILSAERSPAAMKAEAVRDADAAAARSPDGPGAPPPAGGL